MKFRHVLLLLVVFLAPVLLTGCGIRGNPQPPGPAKDVTYPPSFPPA